MGAHHSIKFLIQDNDFTDSFVRHHLQDNKFIHYLCNKKENFKESIINKNQEISDSLNNLNYLNLGQYIDLRCIPTLKIDKGGVHDYDIETFTEQVLTDLKLDVNKNTPLDLVLTGNCSPIVDIFTKIFKEKQYTPGTINIYITFKNNKNYDQALYNSLYDLQEVIGDETVLQIHEFNSYSSMGKGLKSWKEQEPVCCFTTNDFAKKITKLSKTNKFAKKVVNYSIELYKPLINKIVKNISNALTTFETLDIDISDIKYIKDCVNFYIKDVIENGNVNIAYCTRISLDLQTIIDKTNKEIKNVKNTELSNKKKNETLEKLQHVLNWFISKKKIFDNNLIYIPVHNLASVLLYEKNGEFLTQKGYGIKNGKFFNVVTEKSENDKNINLIHYYANNSLLAIKSLENLILDKIN
jgi:hypothetical protein